MVLGPPRTPPRSSSGAAREIASEQARGIVLLALGRRAERCRDLEAAAAAGAEVDAAANAECPALGPASTCSGERWGGWAGNDSCASIAKLIVPGAHRECRSDADCVRAGTDCAPHAVSKSSREGYGSVPLACTDSAAAPCASRPNVACDGGCCVVR